MQGKIPEIILFTCNFVEVNVHLDLAIQIHMFLCVHGSTAYKNMCAFVISHQQNFTYTVGHTNWILLNTLEKFWVCGMSFHGSNY